jgi:hypothetical protein
MWKCTLASCSSKFAFAPSEPQEKWTTGDIEQWMEELRKQEERRRREEEQKRRTQKEREEIQSEKERKNREKGEEDRRRSEEEGQESPTQAERARQAMKEFRIKRQKEHEAERNLHFADGHIEPQDDYTFDRDHPGYFKGEWKRKHRGRFLAGKAIEMLTSLVKKLW